MFGQDLTDTEQGKLNTMFKGSSDSPKRSVQDSKNWTGASYDGGRGSNLGVNF